MTTFVLFYFSSALVFASACHLIVRVLDRREARSLMDQRARNRIGLSRTVEPTCSREPGGLHVISIIVCAILLFAFIGWCANTSDDIRYLRKRVDQLERSVR